MAEFKTKQGVYLTKALFYEMCHEQQVYDKAIFTLGEEDRFIDGIRYQSIQRLFIESNDPTGYEFANKHLGSWYHYEKLLANDWFKKAIEKATKELEVKTKSRALLSIVQEANDKNSKSRFQAAKWLVDKEWVDKKSPVGRPSKAAILEEATKMNEAKEEVEEDFLRLISPDSLN